MRNKLAEIDGYLNYLLSTLSDDDDVIITSDHGMAEVPANQIVTIGEYLNASYYDHAYFQVYTELLLYSKEGFHDLLMDQVMKFVQDHKNFTVSKRDTDTKSIQVYEEHCY